MQKISPKINPIIIMKEWHNFVKEYDCKIVVKKFGCALLNHWCSYLVFRDLSGYRKKQMDYLWRKKNPLNHLRGWNGGVTLIKKEREIIENGRVVTIGHDYCHSWDLDKEYSFEYIYEDTLNIAKEAHEFLQKKI